MKLLSYIQYALSHAISNTVQHLISTGVFHMMWYCSRCMTRSKSSC